MNLLYLIPKNLLSLIVGYLVHLPLPRPLTRALIAKFSQVYKINLSEAEKDISEYASLGDFFVRHLKKNSRPIGEGWCVHPADSVLTAQSRVEKNMFLSVKGQRVSLSEFLVNPKAQEIYTQGQSYTYYLCPADYHRVHSPVTGTIKKITHVPGHLWPVNDWAVKNIKNLFLVNERVIVEIETNRGLTSVVFVGATNVGSIELSFDNSIKTNKLFRSERLTKDYNIQIQKGDELGLFRMGSTVVVIYPQVIAGHLNLPLPVKVNANLF